MAGILIVAFHGTIISVRALPDLPSDKPVLFIDPVDPIVAPGEDLIVSVKMFNLTNANLYGFELTLTWDPTILNYSSHIITIPVETYPEGILHSAVMPIANIVDSVGGTYEIAQTSLFPAAGFNRPDGNSTIFNMTFSALGLGFCTLNITHSAFANSTASPIDHTVLYSDVTVIPEFPSVVFLPLLMTAAVLIVLVGKKKQILKL